LCSISTLSRCSQPLPLLLSLLFNLALHIYLPYQYALHRFGIGSTSTSYHAWKHAVLGL
jgi:hypothetical protein